MYLTSVTVVLTVSIGILLNSVKAKDPYQVEEHSCSEYGGAYARLSEQGVTCCANDTLKLPNILVDNWESNQNLDDCTLKFTSYDNDDMPTGMWKVTLCIFKNASAFGKDSPTFDAFFKFVTSNYPEKIKSSIKTLTDKCKADADKPKEEHKKMQKYFECLHKSEHKVCDKPYKKLEPHGDELKLPKKHSCEGREGILGIHSSEFCCKKESVPYNIVSFYLHFPRSGDFAKADKCVKSFTDRQITLKPDLKKQLTEPPAEKVELLEFCHFGCHVRLKDYVNAKDLKFDFDAISKTMYTVYGKKLQDALTKVVVGRKSAFKYYKEDGKTMTLKEITKKFEGADEINKIRIYCGFYSNIYLEVERGIHEYCMDKEFADAWAKLHAHEITG